jgi:hypothetical protein
MIIVIFISKITLKIINRILIINKINGQHNKNMFKMNTTTVMVGIKLMILVISSTLNRTINTLIHSNNKTISNIILETDTDYLQNCIF